jgi:hypothetical protein
MGNIVKRFLTVYASDPLSITEAWEHARRVFPPELVTPLMRGTVNVALGFVVWTCGGKEGWPDDEAHCTALSMMDEWLGAYRRTEAGVPYNPLRWHLVALDDEILDIEAVIPQDDGLLDIRLELNGIFE